MKTIITTIVALGAAVLAVPAVAAPHSPIEIYGIKHVGGSFIIEVPYDDLDLRQPSEVGVLSARVNRAARKVCAPKLYQPRLDTAQEQACLDGAIAEAAPQISLARKRAAEFARNGTSSIPEVAVAFRAAF